MAVKHVVFRVGVKCLLKRYDATDGYAICHIQEMSIDKYECTVFVEGTGEILVVPCASLRALPKEQCSWGVPIKHWRPRYTAPPPSPKHVEYYKQHGEDKLMYPAAVNRYASIEFFQPPPQQFIAMPFMKQTQPQHEVANETKQDVENPIDEMSEQQAHVDSGYVTEFNSTGSTQPFNTFELPAGSFPMPPPQHVPQGVFQPYIVPTAYTYQAGTNQLWANEMQYPSPSITPGRLGAVNFSARPSTQCDGGDLPNIATLRYFYNLGIDSYNRRIALSGEVSPDSDQINQEVKASDQSSHDSKQQEQQSDFTPQFRGRRDYGYGGQRRGRGRGRGRGNSRGNGRNGEMYRFFDNKRDQSPMHQNEFQNEGQHGTPTMNYPPPPPPPAQQHFNEYDQQQFIPYVQPQFVQPAFYPYQVMPQMTPAPLSAQHSNSSMMDYQNPELVQEPPSGCLWYPPNPQMSFYVMPPPQQQFVPAPQQFQQVFPADPNNGNTNNNA